jgi:hypothetical protein
MATFEEERDQSLKKLRARLAERAITASALSLLPVPRHDAEKRPDMRSGRTARTS